MYRFAECLHEKKWSIRQRSDSTSYAALRGLDQCSAISKPHARVRAAQLRLNIECRSSIAPRSGPVGLHMHGLCVCLPCLLHRLNAALPAAATGDAVTALLSHAKAQGAPAGYRQVRVLIWLRMHGHSILSVCLQLTSQTALSAAAMAKQLSLASPKTLLTLSLYFRSFASQFLSRLLVPKTLCVKGSVLSICDGSSVYLLCSFISNSLASPSISLVTCTPMCQRTGVCMML